MNFFHFLILTVSQSAELKKNSYISLGLNIFNRTFNRFYIQILLRSYNKLHVYIIDCAVLLQGNKDSLLPRSTMPNLVYLTLQQHIVTLHKTITAAEQSNCDIHISVHFKFIIVWKKLSIKIFNPYYLKRMRWYTVREASKELIQFTSHLVSQNKIKYRQIFVNSFLFM